MKYPDEYLSSKDIDWFCILNDQYIHVASAGGALPDCVNDRDTLRTLQHNVFMADDLFADEDIIVNENFLRQRFNGDQEKREQYLQSFRAMARKGFISLDRTNLVNTEDARYHVVCMPRNPENKRPQLNAEIPSFVIGNLQIEEPVDMIDFTVLLE